MSGEPEQQKHDPSAHVSLICLQLKQLLELTNFSNQEQMMDSE